MNPSKTRLDFLMHAEDGHVTPPPPVDGEFGPPPADELDGLLREWHDSNAARAAAGRDRLLAALKAGTEAPGNEAADSDPDPLKPSTWITIRRITMNRIIPIAAAAALAIIALPYLFSRTSPFAVAKNGASTNVVMCPDGGRLEALDKDGLTLGPCVLKHTDVKAVVQGHFTRVTVTQKYHNPHKDKIEAVYTFPLSHRAAVDRMNMTVGNRVIIGQVKEREAAREMYESARDAGRIASLLEQERPNIFTQTIANIDPGADIDIEISYVETLEAKNGQYTFAFPTVVSPRYIPGDQPIPLDREPPRRADGTPPNTGVRPAGFTHRRGIILAAPAEIRLVAARDDAARSAFDTATFAATLPTAEAIAPPLPNQAEKAEGAPATAEVLYRFEAAYSDGSIEPGEVLVNNVGHVGGRWFFLPDGDRFWHRPPSSPVPDADASLQVRGRAGAPQAGEPFSGPTNQVPDAHRITPTPVRPPLRAGHDISVSVEIDTGGAGLVNVTAPIHDVNRQDIARRADGLASRTVLTLANRDEIPNRDFVLTWKQTADTITDSVFTSHARQGDFFTVILNPPARVDDAQAVPRELVFVLDTSGSMNGKPIEKAKAVAAKMIDTMRPSDTFNFITFAGRTQVLWPEPRPNTDANRQEALAFFSARGGSGGTEMMTAINAALEQRTGGAPRPMMLNDLVNLPADGRNVAVEVPVSAIQPAAARHPSVPEAMIQVRTDLSVRATNLGWPLLNQKDQPIAGDDGHDQSVVLNGVWTTSNGERQLSVQSVTFATTPVVNPLRIVVFLTDGEVGNDMAIIDAIKRNRGTTRVFSFGIGNSVNRYLLSEMARQGGGSSEFVLIPRNLDADGERAIDTQAEQAAIALHERTRTPVLTNITLAFSSGLSVADLEPNSGILPDLWDVEPVVICGRLTQPGFGTITIRGNTASGPWEKTLRIGMDGRADAADARLTTVGGDGVVPTLWARARIDSLMNQNLASVQAGTLPKNVRDAIVRIGENFGIMSQYTSFVAVDYQRVTIQGKPRLVRVPIELPDQTSWENYFCTEILAKPIDQLSRQVQEAAKAQAAWEAQPVDPDDSPKAGADDGLTVQSATAAVGGRMSSVNAPPAAQPAAPGRKDEQAPTTTAAMPTPSPKPAARPNAPAEETAFKKLPELNRTLTDAKDISLREAEKVGEATTTGRFRGLSASSPEPTIGTRAQAENLRQANSTLSLEAGYQIRRAQVGLRLGVPNSAADFNRDGAASEDDLRAYFFSHIEHPGQLGRLYAEFSTLSATDAEAPGVYGFLLAKEGVAAGEAGTGGDVGLAPPPSRLVHLAAAKLVVATLQAGDASGARAIADQFKDGVSDSEVLRESIALIPEAPARPEAGDTQGSPTSEPASADRSAGSQAPTIDPARLEAVAAKVQSAFERERRLLRILGPDLYALVTMPRTAAENRPIAGKSLGATDAAPERILVGVLVSDLNALTFKALNFAGLEVQSTLTESKTVIGFVRMEAIEALALIEGVRRIERIEDAPPVTP